MELTRHSPQCRHLRRPGPDLGRPETAARADDGWPLEQGQRLCLVKQRGCQRQQGQTDSSEGRPSLFQLHEATPGPPVRGLWAPVEPS